MKKIYNSALKHVPDTNKAGKCSYFNHQRYSIMTCDIITQDLHKDYIDCDVLYTEAPFPHGCKYFDEKAEVNDNRTYNDLAQAIEGVIELSIPTYLVSSRTMMNKFLPKDKIIELKLSGRGGSAYLGVFNENIEILKLIDTTSTETLITDLAHNYNCLGDFMCGYGQNVIDFINAGGKRFVASDYDSRAVGYLKRRLEDLF